MYMRTHIIIPLSLVGIEKVIITKLSGNENTTELKRISRPIRTFLPQIAVLSNLINFYFFVFKSLG